MFALNSNERNMSGGRIHLRKQYHRWEFVRTRLKLRKHEDVAKVLLDTWFQLHDSNGMGVLEVSQSESETAVCSDSDTDIPDDKCEPVYVPSSDEEDDDFESQDESDADESDDLYDPSCRYVGRFTPRKEPVALLGDKMKRCNNVYIKNFGDELDEDGIRDIFGKYGKIISAKVMTDEQGKSRGFGFVNYELPEAAEMAVDAVNGIKLGGNKILYAGRAQKKAERQTELKDKFEKIKMERINRYQGVNLYVKNLDDVVDDERLRKEFSRFGTITSARVMSEGGRSKGFGFVCFSSPEEATKAVTEMNGRTIVSKSLYVALAQRKEDRRAHLASQYMQRMTTMRQQAVDAVNGIKLGGNKILYAGRAQKNAERQTELQGKFEKIKMERINRYQGVNLYIKNLDDVVDDERLRKEFSRFGTITSARVMSEGGRSKGFGFVCFSSPEEATKAVTEMNGRTIVSKSLYVAHAQRKEDRRAHLASQYMQRMTTMRQQQTAQFNRMFQPTGAGYFVPTMPQAQRDFFAPTQMPQVRASPRWQTGARPTQSAGGFQGMPSSAQVRATAPRTAQSAVCAGVNARPITEQSAGEPASANPQCVVTPRQDPLTAYILAAAPPHEQKQMFEERLFPLIQRMYPDLARKITGMLLEIDNSELLHMLESNQSLKAKVEAIAVLQYHQAN